MVEVVCEWGVHRPVHLRVLLSLLPTFWDDGGYPNRVFLWLHEHHGVRVLFGTRERRVLQFAYIRAGHLLCDQIRLSDAWAGFSLLSGLGTYYVRNLHVCL